MILNLLEILLIIACGLIVTVSLIEPQKQGIWFFRGRRVQQVTPTMRVLLIAVIAIVIAMEVAVGDRSLAAGTIAGMLFGYALFSPRRTSSP